MDDCEPSLSFQHSDDNNNCTSLNETPSVCETSENIAASTNQQPLSLYPFFLPPPILKNNHTGNSENTIRVDKKSKAKVHIYTVN